ncbi:MAG: hypothetical protein V1833_05980 [Elusimicrobiota bacterium]
MQTTLTIPRHLTHGDELIIVRREEYKKLQKHLTEVRDALQKISCGEKELHNGRIKSL